MLLLHISDIHFRSPDCTNPEMDPERPFRTRLMQSARGRTLGAGRSVDAILVGGDVAFKGDPVEYAAAVGWLKELTDACGCQFGRIFVVPGNHDVDRRTIQKSVAVRNTQLAIQGAATDRRERVLREQFADAGTGASLLAPLAAYNGFAKLFNCQVYSPDRLYWRQDLALEGGVRLRIHGLTSTLLSGVGDHDDTRGALYLSPLQTVLDPIDDTVNLVMCHHPPDWFMDNDEVDDALRGRAAIHLFGHKHRRRVFRDPRYIRLAAGAVNPDRQELGWQPAYNLIELRVVGEGNERRLVIEAHLLEWQFDPEQFRPVLTEDGGEVFYHTIPLPAWNPAGVDYESRLISIAKREHKSPDFLKMNPRGEIPVMKHDDFVLTESLAIMAYLDRLADANPLFGESAREAARIWQATSDIVYHFEGAVAAFADPALLAPPSEEMVAKMRAALPVLHEECAMLERRLEVGRYLCGTELSAADIAAFPFFMLIRRALGKEITASVDHHFLPLEERYPNLAAWQGLIESAPGYEKVYPPHWRGS